MREANPPTVALAPPLVGRDRDLDQLVSVVRTLPAVVVVEGEAGIGKTRLVAELTAHPALADRRVLTGACHRIREPFPLGPLVEAVRGLEETLIGADLSPVVGALRPLLPELAGVLPPRPETLDDRAGQRHQVFRGMVGIVAAAGPVTLVVEDLHWADEQTVEFLEYLVSAPPAGLALVLTLRGEEASPDVRAVTARLPASVGRMWVTLQPLDMADTGAMAAALLGVDHVSDEFAGHLWRRSGGLPLAIHELLALLQARGTLVRDGDGWARRVLAELDVPAGIRDPVRERASRLGPAARSVLEAAAVVQAPFDETLLLSLARVPAPEAAEGLVGCLASGLLVEHRTGTEHHTSVVGFRHVLAAQAVYEGIAGPHRRELHARAAAAMRGVDPMPAGQVAHHLRNAGRLTEWAGAAETAADQAVALGDDAEAVRLLADVLRHAPLDAGERGRLAVKLGRAALDSLRWNHEVIDLLTAALDHDQPASVRGELRVTLGVLFDNFQDTEQQRRFWIEAIPDLDGRPDLMAWAMVGLGLPRYPAAVPSNECRMWLHRALQVLPEVDNPVFEVFLLGKITMVLALMGDPRWRAVTDEIGQRTGGAAQHFREVNAYHSVAVGACYAGHHAVAAELLGRAAEAVVGGQHAALGLRIQLGLVMVDYCRGRWDGLRDRLAQLVEAEPSRHRSEGEVVAGCLELTESDLDAAAGRLDRVVRRLNQVYALDALPIAVAASARLAVARGEPDHFLAELDGFVALYRSSGVWASAVRALPALTQALAVAGRVDEARALVAMFADEVRDLDAPLAPAALHHARGFLDAAGRRWREAAGHFRTAADRYEPLLCPYEMAQAREEAARCLFAAGTPAEEELRAALATFRRLGARWDEDRVAGIARKYGVSLPARHRGGPRGYGAALSPREREVADLAATGRTNREIASELFLSLKTVDKHLSAALRKLGLRSRIELARQVGGDGAINGGSSP